MRKQLIYCCGKHQCELCFKIFSCEGESMSHSGENDFSGRCHGEYMQFCPNHTLEEYREALGL